MRSFSMKSLFCSAVLFTLAACGGSSPTIANAEVNPSTVAQSGFVTNATFVVSCDVLHFGGDIKTVRANVEGKNISVDLARSGGALGAEKWSGTAQVTLLTGFSAGVYQIDITASDSNGVTTTKKAATSVTITQ